MADDMGKIIYIVTRSDEIGGAQIHVRDVANAMLKKKADPLVLVGGEGPLLDQLYQRGIPYQTIPNLIRPIRPWKDFFALIDIYKSLKRYRPNLVSLHSSKAGLLGRLAAKAAGIPAIFTAHGWTFTVSASSWTRHLYIWIERFAAILAKRVITVSETDRGMALHTRVASSRKLTTIHNGMPDVSRDLLASPGKMPVHIVMTARFSSPKDHHTLLQALAQIGASQEWSLELIGTGPGQMEVADQVNELGFEDRVEFAGEVDDVARRLSRGQLYVLTSNWEGLPRSIIEAMRAGLPVVASNVGGVSEMVRDGENGFLVEPGNVEQLSERLQKVLSDPELRQRMGEKSRRYFEEGFRFEEMVEKTLEVYRAVVDEARGKDQKRKKLPTE